MLTRDEIERAKFLEFAHLLDVCFPAEHEDEQPGGDNIRTLLADRDRLAAELARVRRNHLRRMEDAIWEAFDRIAPKTDEVQEIALDRLNTLRHRIRAALAQPQDGTTEGRG